VPALLGMFFLERNPRRECTGEPPSLVLPSIMSRRARALPYLFLLLLPLGYALGCGNSSGTDGSGGGGPTTGGATSTGGAGPTTGGATATGGDSSTTGGATSTGGTDATGGGATTGGATSTGGGDGTGGGGPTTGGIVPGTDNYDCSPASGTVPALQLVEVTDGLDTPILVTHAPNDLERMFVVEQNGSIAIVENGTVLETRFLEFEEKVFSEPDGMGAFNEQGFLGLAFHPDYETNGLFYVHYNAAASGNVYPGATNGDAIVSEFHVSDDPNVADAASERVVLFIDDPAVNHNGGTIAFGSDGYLYYGLGDGGGGGDPNDNGQNPATLNGKILRIDPLESGEEPYTTPADNLIEAEPSAAPEVWDYGLRNPYRFNFDACTGALYIGDVGQNAWEEVNVELAGEGHKNYGWNVMEATHCYEASTCDETGLTLPIAEYENPQPVNQGDPNPSRAVIGGTVYRGADVSALRGAYFYLDAYSGETWYLFYNEDSGEVTGPTRVDEDLNPAGDELFIAAIQNAADGELLFVSRGQGAIYQLALE